MRLGSLTGLTTNKSTWPFRPFVIRHNAARRSQVEKGALSSFK